MIKILFMRLVERQKVYFINQARAKPKAFIQNTTDFAKVWKANICRVTNHLMIKDELQNVYDLGL